MFYSRHGISIRPSSTAGRQLRGKNEDVKRLIRMVPANLFLTMLCLVCSIAGCGSQSGAPARTNLSVAAAANLRFAFDDVRSEFEVQYPDIDLQMTYGSSGILYAQLSQQAPFDIFFSADTEYPRRPAEQQAAAESSLFTYAVGRIVVWVPKASPIDLEAQGIQAIVGSSGSASGGKIAIANPRLAPYGSAAEQALKHAGIYDDVRDRLILGDNISQTAQFVDSGAADVGIIAMSLALTPEMRARGRYLEIPSDTHEPIAQAGMIPDTCREPVAAKKLRDFVVGPAGRRILERHGYSTPEGRP